MINKIHFKCTWKILTFLFHPNPGPNLRPLPDCWNRNKHSDKSPRVCTGTSKCEKHPCGHTSQAVTTQDLGIQKAAKMERDEQRSSSRSIQPHNFACHLSGFAYYCVKSIQCFTVYHEFFKKALCGNNYRFIGSYKDSTEIPCVLHTLYPNGFILCNCSTISKWGNWH